MTDEEFLALGEEEYVESASAESETPVEEGTVVEEEDSSIDEGTVQTDPEPDTIGSSEEPDEDFTAILDNEEDPEPKETDTEEVDYQEFYSQVMKPFKANGKMVELRSPDEAVQLMQMGSNYTQKMQEIASARKLLKTLE